MTMDSKLDGVRETMREATDIVLAVCTSPEALGVVNAITTSVKTCWPLIQSIDDMAVDADIAAIEKMKAAGFTQEQAVALRVAGKQGRNSITGAICTISQNAITKSM